MAESEESAILTRNADVDEDNGVVVAELFVVVALLRARLLVVLNSVLAVVAEIVELEVVVEAVVVVPGVGIVCSVAMRCNSLLVNHFSQDRHLATTGSGSVFLLRWGTRD